MPYIKKKITTSNGKKAYEILLNLGYSMKESQRLIDKKRLFCGDEILVKNSVVFGDIFLVDYECESRGLEPIFEDDKFAAFDKPSGVLTHPNGRNCLYSMNDEIWSKFGKNASVAHRLDKETSGVLLVAKNKMVEKEIKLKFEKGEVGKKYLAMAKGIIESDFEVCASLGLDENAKSLKNKIYVKDSGKFAHTKFKVLEIYPKFNATLLECIPLTGRQHQIRVHLFHVKHPIIGDTMYGVSDEFAEGFLDEMISDETRAEVAGAKRLLLHSQSIKFEFNSKIYDINSNFHAKNEFLKEIKI